MIRINLLSEGRRPVAPKQPKLTTSGMDPSSLALVALFVVALLVALGHNFLLGRAVEAKKGEVAEAQREVDELAPIIREVEEFKAKKAELEHKVTVINDLKARQHGPVRILDFVSRAIPELLWLEKMDVKSNSIKLTGKAFNTNAVANFIENLDVVPAFQEPVLKETKEGGQVYNFVIEVNYSFAPSPPAAGDAAGGDLTS